MRVIPPKQYTGKIPEGYNLKDFCRFDQSDGETFGVLYSGERVNVNETKKANPEYKQSLVARIWGGIKDILKGGEKCGNG